MKTLNPMEASKRTAARGVRKRAYTFALITTVAKDIFRSQYHREILAGLFEAAGRQGHHLQLSVYRPGHYRSLSEILRQYPDVDGFFMIAWRWFDARLTALIRKNRESLPVLLFNDFEPSLNLHVLYTDVRQGMRHTVSYLYERGYRHMGMLHGPLHISFGRGPNAARVPFVDVREKIAGVKEGLKKYSLPFRKKWFQAGSAYSYEEGYRLAKKLLKEKQRPEVLICGNDDLALGALEAVKESGLRCPEDIAVTGFDNTEKAGSTPPGLTTRSQPLAQMGYDAVKILIDGIKNPAGSPLQKCYPTRLVTRETV